ncbi:MAG: FHA domain-containing protein [Candidatus Pacebacteria bacterium]|nr:FHA domain-containing protein [Candidatus Paceibacterota bacterium]
MPFLKYTKEGTVVQRELRSPDTTIGRASECSISIKNDAEISRYHCSVQRKDKDTFVVLDTSSKNGTYLNGERLLDEEVELKDEDRIRVGHTVLTFLKEKDSSTIKALEDVAQEMEQGKGYQTILREIVKKDGRR